jgi:cyclic lactone autoinducer peptide
MKDMKAKFSAAVKNILKSVAVASSETTSFLSLYQPKTPKALVKSEKK